MLRRQLLTEPLAHQLRDGRWHQTYVDTVGGRLVLVGSFDGRRMVLQEGAATRWVWESLSADSIRYAGERTTDGGQTWTPEAEARYTRR